MRKKRKKLVVATKKKVRDSKPSRLRMMVGSIWLRTQTIRSSLKTGKLRNNRICSRKIWVILNFRHQFSLPRKNHRNLINRTSHLLTINTIICSLAEGVNMPIRWIWNRFRRDQTALIKYSRWSLKFLSTISRGNKTIIHTMLKAVLDKWLCQDNDCFYMSNIIICKFEYI